MEEQKSHKTDSPIEGEPNAGNPKESFFLIVTAIIRNAEGKILLQKRVDLDIPAADGKWELPGGKINTGETPEDAIIRECQEETGYTVALTRKIRASQNLTWEKKDGSKLLTHVICFEARPVKEGRRPFDPKVSDVQWFTEDEINSLDLLNGEREFLAAARKWKSPTSRLPQ